MNIFSTNQQKPKRIYVVSAMKEGYTAEPIRAFQHKCEAQRYERMIKEFQTFEEQFDYVWTNEVMLY